MGKVSLLSLGCPKNLVDSENLLKQLADRGIAYTTSYDDSDILLINTCGFIEDAKKESIEEILKFVDIKNKGNSKRLVVFGCLAKRYGTELKKEIPEIDAIYGVGEEEKITEYCIKNCKNTNDNSISERFSDLPYAYIKIAEGCDRACTYCIIPEIRGKFRSRQPEDILKDAEELVYSGKKELIIIAQDITSYGKEYGSYSLGRLIREVAAIKGDFWIRLLYLYPTSIDDELIETIKNEKKVCKYLDLPLQHSEERILRLMGRGGSREFYKKLILKLRGEIPDVTIRTTFIVGFPGETEEDFERLIEFVKEIRFERLGAFMYSREEKTKAARMKGHLRKKIKMDRYRMLMEVQSGISLEKNRALIGKTFRTLIDENDDGTAILRLYSQAPEIDGVVYVRNCSKEKGSFVDVRIDSAYDYDLEGVLV